MNIKEKILLHVFCSLFSISISIPHQWTKQKQTDLPVHEITAPTLGTISFSDSHQWVESKDAIEEKIRKTEGEERTNEGRSPEQRKTDAEAAYLQKLERELYELLQSYWETTSLKFFQTRKTPSEEVLKKSLSQKLKTLNNYLKTLRKQSLNLQDLIGDIQSLQTSLLSRKPNKGKIKIENKMKNENWMLETDSQAMNNTGHNNRYQIGTIFIINRLSEGKELDDSKFNGCKEADGNIFTELTARKMKDLFMLILNYLQEEHFPKTTETVAEKTADKLVEKVESDFRQMFTGRNVTSKEIDQMSKIIDFVKKYQGVVSDPANWSMPKGIEEGGGVSKNKEAVTREKIERKRRSRRI